ncbi:MAG: LEA type 2 family protein [Lysobacter sp.]|nr:LEA type 2 family protein [Lysobacter sp.]
MNQLGRLALIMVLTALSACGSGGPVRRVSEPAASIQQITVRANGSWAIDLRIENFSTVPMRFDAVSLMINMGGQVAGTLQGTPGISIGPESAEVVSLSHTPSSGARIVLADALSASRSVNYSFKGTLSATPDKGGTRSYEVERSSSLSPAPGLPGVLR